MRLYGVGAFSAVVLLAGCGAKTALPVVEHDSGPGSGTLRGCYTDNDCDGAGDLCKPIVCNTQVWVCQPLPVVNCDDGDPCTQDTCVSATGTCKFVPLTVDNDGDGYKGPRPGYAPGAPGSCGDDCDDTSAAAHPGGVEICDGLDNDCNGIVDDNTLYEPSGDDPVLLTSGEAPASPAGLAWSGSAAQGFLAGITLTDSGQAKVVTQQLGADGSAMGAATNVTDLNSDAYGGVIVRTGSQYGIAWEDRRDGDYEIYFNRTDMSGAKLGPDLRITYSPGFSINPQIAFNGQQYLIVWQDDRFGNFEIMGAMVDLQGNLLDQNLRLTNSMLPSESPFLAVGTLGLGLVYSFGGTGAYDVKFLAMSVDMTPSAEPVLLTTSSISGSFPMVVFNKPNYVVAWYDAEHSPYAIYGAVLDEAANVRVSPAPITFGSRHSRYPWLTPLGDRLILTFSDDRDQNSGYELYTSMLYSNLKVMTAEQRITFAAGDSVFPMVALGRTAEAGILFRDDRLQAQNVYFSRLNCVGVE